MVNASAWLLFLEAGIKPLTLGFVEGRPVQIDPVCKYLLQFVTHSLPFPDKIKFEQVMENLITTDHMRCILPPGETCNPLLPL